MPKSRNGAVHCPTNNAQSCLPARRSAADAAIAPPARAMNVLDGSFAVCDSMPAVRLSSRAPEVRLSVMIFSVGDSTSYIDSQHLLHGANQENGVSKGIKAPKVTDDIERDISYRAALTSNHRPNESEWLTGVRLTAGGFWSRREVTSFECGSGTQGNDAHARDCQCEYRIETSEVRY
jgi:hypothetical protein